MPRYAAPRTVRPPDPPAGPSSDDRQEPEAAPEPPRRQLPDLRDPRFSIERETLKLVIQHPSAVGRSATGIGPNDFTHPTYRAVWEAVAANGGPSVGASDPGWASKVRSAAADPAVSSAISELGVEPVRVSGDPAASYVDAHVYRLQELTALRRIADLKSRLQRTNPVEQGGRLQQDVRRAGRPRAAPAQPARDGDGSPGMRLPFRDAASPEVAVGAGEKVLAWCRTTDGAVLAGTRDALYLPDRRVPWEQVEAADWDRDTSVLRVSEVGSWGELRPEHTFTLDDPRRLLQLVRERVTASVVYQRHVPVRGRTGLRVIARRAPSGREPIAWIYEYDDTIDPDDPAVRAAAGRALAAARDEVGLT